MELPHMDIDSDADTSPGPPTVLTIGIQAEATVETPLDEDRDKQVPPKPVEVDVKVFDQEAMSQVPRSVSPAKNQSANNLQTKTFTWKNENWSGMIDAAKIGMWSETFVMGGYEWTLFLLCGGAGYFQHHLSLHLVIEDSAESPSPSGWSRFAFVTLDVVNQRDPKLPRNRRVITYQFNQASPCVGFDKFMSMADLHDPDRGFLVDDSLIIEMEVDLRRVADYDCRKETGFVGLKNQGATCYLNSLIQTLYHLPLFRKAVYRIPTSRNDLPSESIPLALQSLFYKIQYSDTSPETEDLTKSFRRDSSREEDAHELSLLLRKELEVKMKGTLVDKTIEQLFEGHVNNHIECIDVDYTSTSKEPFQDLHLDVKGCKDVYASLDKYVEVEKLEGDNQYRAGQYGLQDARKGPKFIDLPPVLQLHLKRFEYDSNKDVPMMKINDRYEFPLQLDLDRENGKYLSAIADRSVRNLYSLHSVLVHKLRSSVESVNYSGHYYAFIRPTLSDQWYKFNDDLVTKEESKTVLEEQCGADEDPRHSSAYMLLYIRESEKEKVVCTVEQEDIPEHLQTRFKEEEEAERQRGKKRSRCP